MNGRAYDYNLGRFLSVDPVIQSPGNSQSLNPYSYIMNNPLAGTDPTGYCSKELGSNICRKEPSSVQVSATLAGNIMAKAAQAAVNDNGARQSQPQSQAGQQTSVVDKFGLMDAVNTRIADVHLGDNSDKSPTDVSDDIYVNINFKGKIKTFVDVKNKIYGLTIKLLAGTDDLEMEQMSDYISGINKEFTVEGLHSNGYKLVLRTEIEFDDKNPDFYINECPGWCETGTRFNNAGRSAPGSKLIELSSGIATQETAAHEFGHMIGFYHQENSTKSLMSYAHLEGHDRVLTNKDLERLFHAYRRAGYE